MSWFGWNENAPSDEGAKASSSPSDLHYSEQNGTVNTINDESGDETDFFDLPDSTDMSTMPQGEPSVIDVSPRRPIKSSKPKKKSSNELHTEPNSFLKLNSKMSPPSPVIDFEGIDPPDQDGPDLQVVIDQVFNLTSRQFFEFFISDHPVFSFADFHLLRGDKDILIGNWGDHVPLSPEEQAKSKYEADPRIRPGTLERKLKLNLQVDSSYSRLHKVQRLVPSPKHDGFIVITHAITPDVIFGTQFSVTDIWRLQDIPGQRQCRLRISLGGLFMNAGWAVTMLIPIIRSRIVSEGQEMWQHWAEVAKLRVSRLAHELLSSPGGGPAPSGNASGAEAASDEEDSAGETEYTEDERHAATGGLASVGGVSGMVFDQGLVNEELQQTLDALRKIELNGDDVVGEERKRHEEIIRQQVRDQQKQMAERKAEKERLHAKLLAQQKLLKEQEEARAKVASEAGPTKPVESAAAVSPTAPAENPDGRTHIEFNLSACELESESESSSESDTDAEEVAQMTMEERLKHDKRVRRRAKAHRRKHQKKLLKEAKRSANEPLPNAPGLPSAVAAGMASSNDNGKMHMSLAEIATREAKVAEDLAVQNQRMCTRDCSQANPCVIM